ncbi:SAM-dependent methyltransferase [Flocculibacter collagenilyticus]|uniref:SAM-dependent methyltransferase n=1 Tax=Flocculibacter collagenilyticus TaxID=2744479 RepID=UPI0018F358A1|nr:cyclopropane-fatty-acyl-phospholipid synthase family protein [Flocculibacter collagenilyticus]
MPLEREFSVNQSASVDTPVVDTTNNVWQRAFLKLLDYLEHDQLRVTLPNGETRVFGSANPALREDKSTAPIIATLQVRHAGFFKRVLFGGSIAFGETYVDGWWETDDLTHLIQLFARNLTALEKIEGRFSWLTLPFQKIKHWFNNNSISQAKKNILAHYDLGNVLYENFLDETMCYSSGLYESDSDTLAQAQRNKMRRILEQLDISPGDHVLEIGTGWGGLAILAATEYGCTVTTTTLSDEQHRYAEACITKANLQNKITLLKQDYRLLTGQYDKIVSVEMIEAVGRKYLPTFFEQCNKLLKPGGKLALQSITIADQQLESYANNVDFIQKHIFPGGFLPSVTLLQQHITEYSDMVTRNVFDFGVDYATTLTDWRTNLLEKKALLNSEGYDERFFRLWLYYFAYCEGGFLEKTISVIHLTAEKQRA